MLSEDFAESRENNFSTNKLGFSWASRERSLAGNGR